MLVRYPPEDPLIRLAQRAPAVKTTLLNADRGAQRVVSPIDGQDRLVIVHSLAHYPVVLLISRTVAATLQPWREQVQYYAAIAVLIDLSLAGVVLLGIRHLKRGHLLTQAHASRAAAEAGRAASDERERHGRALAAYYSRFDTAVSSMSQGLCMFDAQNRLIISNPRLATVFCLAPEASAAGTPLVAILRAVVRGPATSAPKTFARRGSSLSAPDSFRDARVSYGISWTAAPFPSAMKPRRSTAG